MSEKIHASMRFSPLFRIAEAINRERIKLMDEIFSMTLEEFKKAKADYEAAQKHEMMVKLAKLPVKGTLRYFMEKHTKSKNRIGLKNKRK